MEASKIADTEEIYNPKSSFFDNISCEGKGGRNEGARRTTHEMRAADSETFGSESVGEVRSNSLFFVQNSFFFRIAQIPAGPFPEVDASMRLTA
jgi:hypothetical protein